jgi:phospholipid/cholesterol/gamma-HCH transport system substrate-binding protein
MSRKLKVGLFVGGTLAVAAVFILLVGDVSYVFKKPGYTLNVEVATAAGLDTKAVVKMAGVKIGFVKGIELSGIRARVVMDIDAEVRVPDDSEATFATLGLIGEKYVEINPGESATFCPDGGIIQGSQKPGFDQVGELLSGVGSKLQEAAGSLRDTLDEETRAKLKAALDGAAGATEELRRFLEQNRGGFQALIQGADRTVEDLGRTVSDMAEKIDRTLGVLRDAVTETRSPLKDDLAKIGEAVDKLRELLERIERGEGTAGKIVRDPSLYNEASEVIASVKKTVGSLAGVKGYADFQAGYYGSSELLRSSLSAGLRVKEKSFVEAGLVRDPWAGEFRFSLQGGIRLGSFAPRAGFIENELGLGLDYFGGEAWGLSLEGFAFNRAESPRVRLTGKFYPARNVYLMAGADDFTLARRREVFFGLGLVLR